MANYSELVEILKRWSGTYKHVSEQKLFFINPHPELLFSYDISVANKVTSMVDLETLIQDTSGRLTIYTDKQPANDVKTNFENVIDFLKDFDDKFYAMAARALGYTASKPLS